YGTTERHYALVGAESLLPPRVQIAPGRERPRQRLGEPGEVRHRGLAAGPGAGPPGVPGRQGGVLRHRLVAGPGPAPHAPAGAELDQRRGAGPAERARAGTAPRRAGRGLPPAGPRRPEDP